jgi:hypothetical protein
MFGIRALYRHNIRYMINMGGFIALCRIERAEGGEREREKEREREREIGIFDISALYRNNIRD